MFDSSRVQHLDYLDASGTRTFIFKAFDCIFGENDHLAKRMRKGYFQWLEQYPSSILDRTSFCLSSQELDFLLLN
jgi:hypothetical protein